jgi:hypothetical protein
MISGRSGWCEWCVAGESSTRLLMHGLLTASSSGDCASMIRPTERPTPEQWQVAAWMLMGALAAIGLVALWYGFRAPPEKADIARQLVAIGVSSWVAVIGLWAVKRGVEWVVG